MRFNFEVPESNNEDEWSPGNSPTPNTPKDEVEWVLLQNHPVFAVDITAVGGSVRVQSARRMVRNLLAWDGASRLYFWDTEKQCLHRISVRLGEPDSSSVIAAWPSKVMLADIQLYFAVNKITINRNGSALVLTGTGAVCIMYLHGRTSKTDKAIICRTVLVGSKIYADGDNVIHTLQVLWHPYSDTHLGILSSDSVFRLFDLSSDYDQPEQEYYLQPVEPGRSKNAASICPVDFSFGGDHMWDRFSVFVLFGDGSVYIICPVAPFGSVYRWESILEMYTDAHTFGLTSTNAVAVSNSNLAISWLKAIFPELTHLDSECRDMPTLKSHPYALIDMSLVLQGPLCKVSHSNEEKTTSHAEECEGRPVSFLYHVVGEDSVIVTAWSGGQLHIDALTDEIQPLWNDGSPPRLCVDSHDRIVSIAMICESLPGQNSVLKLDQPSDNTLWLGHLPPFLRLGIVDLALPRDLEGSDSVSMVVDPLLPEKIFAVHGGGIDSIVLHFLPFTSLASGRDERVRGPSVHTVLNTCQLDSISAPPTCGFLALSDSFGYSWIMCVMSTRECVVLEMKSWDLLVPLKVEMEKTTDGLVKQMEKNSPDIISKDLLGGPKEVLLPQPSPNLRSVTADSIEGRSALHQYFKLFHENYVEYAHKVYFELKHHGPQLKRILDDQHARFREAQDKLVKVEEKQSRLDDKVGRIVHMHEILEGRLQRLKNLPGVHRKPLTRAERDFKLELERFSGVELDALQSTVEAITARLRRHNRISKISSSSNQRRQTTSGRRGNAAEDTHISQLKSTLAKLSLVNSENSKKVRLVESALKGRERSNS